MTIIADYFGTTDIQDAMSGMGFPFSVALDATGAGSKLLTSADTYYVEGLTINGAPSVTYSAPYRKDLSDVNSLNIQIDNFQAADIGLIVTGRYLLIT